MAALSKPVTMNDVAGIFSVSTTNLSLQTLCQHASVNGYSKYKPIASSVGTPLTDAQWAAADYGLCVPSAISLAQCVAYRKAGTTPSWTPPSNARALTAGWYYKYPTSNYRLSDFWGYNHAGVKELINLSTSSNSVSTIDTTEFWASVYYQQSATMADLFALNSDTMKTYRYFGIACVESTTTTYTTGAYVKYIVASDAGKDGLVRLSTNNLVKALFYNATNNSTYYIIPFLTTASWAGANNLGDTKTLSVTSCIPLPCSMATISVKTTSAVTYSIGITTASRLPRSISFTYSQKNVGGKSATWYLCTNPASPDGSGSRKASGTFTTTTGTSASVTASTSVIALGAGETLYLVLVVSGFATSNAYDVTGTDI